MRRSLPVKVSAWPLTWLPLLLITACVTLNGYVSAAAPEKAADKIIDFIIPGTVGLTQDGSGWKKK